MLLNTFKYLIRQKLFWTVLGLIYLINSAMTYNKKHNPDKVAAYYGKPIVSDRSLQLLQIANEQLGKPYRYGGKGPKSFDCSGLTRYVFGQVDISLGASSSDQALQGAQVDIDKLRPGDLVFFKSADVNSYEIDHVGLMVSVSDESLEFIHSTNKGVMIDDLLTNDYYKALYVSARRVLGNK
jgi:cell wall-associated NlpC family hydrolase